MPRRKSNSIIVKLRFPAGSVLRREIEGAPNRAAHLYKLAELGLLAENLLSGRNSAQGLLAGLASGTPDPAKMAILMEAAKAPTALPTPATQSVPPVSESLPDPLDGMPLDDRDFSKAL